ncbi:hypothetical protein OAQ99_04465 [Candidatus Kapabacteria bacterium]|nr:hypothetical protein [Candidatus Kapabacteria bacterium]
MSQYISNYVWVNNTLTFSISETAVGLKIDVKTSGQSAFITLFESRTLAPTSMPLVGSIGDTIEVKGSVIESGTEEWPEEPPPTTVSYFNPI